MIEYTKTFIGMKAEDAVIQITKDQSIYPEGRRYIPIVLKRNDVYTFKYDPTRLKLFIDDNGIIFETDVG